MDMKDIRSGFEQKHYGYSLLFSSVPFGYIKVEVIHEDSIFFYVDYTGLFKDDASILEWFDSVSGKFTPSDLLKEYRELLDNLNSSHYLGPTDFDGHPAGKYERTQFLTKEIEKLERMIPMKKFSDVKCYYTGGGIYVYSAFFNGEVWLYGGLDNYFGSYDLSGETIEQFHNCNYDAHWKNPSVPFPTWNDILDSLRERYPNNPEVDYMELALRRANPDMNAKCIGEEK